ncbi:MAG: hypothetical protein J7M14_01280, partial [Planctomycetes bacterium]|nr:hypothetical protein [Planctomycetota bacterium]
VMVRSYRRRLKDGMQEFATYNYAGSSELVMDHYARLLEEKGLSRTGRADAGSFMMATFASENTQVTVRLRKHPENLNMSELTVTTRRWDRNIASPRPPALDGKASGQ